MPLSRLSDRTLERLGEFSLTTQEELLGYLEAQEDGSPAFGELLESPQVAPELKQYLRASSNQEIVSGFQAVKNEEYSFGALLPAVSSEFSREVGSQQVLSEAFEPAEEEHIIQGACLPIIKDQGPRGTCVAFATCAVVEFAYCLQNARALELSEQFQFWHCKQNDKSPGTDGTWPNVSFALVGGYGICDESEWPYDPAVLPLNVAHEPPGPSARINTRLPNVPMPALFNKVTVALTITPPTDLAKIRGYISNDSAIAVAIPVFNSWVNNPYTRLTGNIPMPLPGEARMGGHALVLIGWAKDAAFAGGGYFIVRNSWGIRWGKMSTWGAGHGTIPFDFIQRFNRFAHTVKL